MASIIFDISLLVLAILIIVKFTVKGFMRSLLDVAKTILSLAIAFLLRIPVANLFNAWFMDDLMVDLVKNSLKAYLENDPTKIYVDVQNLPDFFKEFLTSFRLDLTRFEVDFEAFFTNGDKSVLNSLADNVGGALATLVSTIIAFAIVTIISYIILSIICYFISHLRKFDGVKTADRVLGVVLGVLVAAVTLWGFAQGAIFVIDYIGPIVPEYIDSTFKDDSMVVAIFKMPNIMKLLNY